MRRDPHIKLAHRELSPYAPWASIDTPDNTPPLVQKSHTTSSTLDHLKADYLTPLVTIKQEQTYLNAWAPTLPSSLKTHFVSISFDVEAQEQLCLQAWRRALEYTPSYGPKLRWLKPPQLDFQVYRIHQVDRSIIDSHHQQLGGRSLTLSLTLACVAWISERRPHLEALCSAEVNDKGELIPVDGVSQKVECLSAYPHLSTLIVHSSQHQEAKEALQRLECTGLKCHSVEIIGLDKLSEVLDLLFPTYISSQEMYFNSLQDAHPKELATLISQLGVLYHQDEYGKKIRNKKAFKYLLDQVNQRIEELNIYQQDDLLSTYDRIRYQWVIASTLRHMGLESHEYTLKIEDFESFVRFSPKKTEHSILKSSTQSVTQSELNRFQSHIQSGQWGVSEFEGLLAQWVQSIVDTQHTLSGDYIEHVKTYVGARLQEPLYTTGRAKLLGAYGRLSYLERTYEICLQTQLKALSIWIDKRVYHSLSHPYTMAYQALAHCGSWSDLIALDTLYHQLSQSFEGMLTQKDQGFIQLQRAQAVFQCVLRESPSPDQWTSEQKDHVKASIHFLNVLIHDPSSHGPSSNDYLRGAAYIRLIMLAHKCQNRAFRDNNLRSLYQLWSSMGREEIHKNILYGQLILTCMTLKLSDKDITSEDVCQDIPELTKPIPVLLSVLEDLRLQSVSTALYFFQRSRGEHSGESSVQDDRGLAWASWITDTFLYN